MLVIGIWSAFWLICLDFGVGSRTVGSNRSLNDEPVKTLSTNAPPAGGGEISPDIPCAHRNQCGRFALLPFHARNCFCDSACRAYGDCCRDYDPTESRDPGAGKVPVIPHSVRGVVSCRRVEEIDTSYEMYMVDSCPRGYKDRFVIDKCENELIPGLFYRLPVTGRTTGVLYRNVYCAICAGDADVIYWEMAYKCPEADWMSNGTLRRIETAEEFRRLTNHLRCPVEMIPPMGKRPRKCKSNIDRCPRKWRDERVANKCRSYTAYVYHGLQVFKNKHCAICNNIDEADVQCEDTRTPWLDFEVGLVEGDAASESATSVYIVFDTNTGSGIVWHAADATKRRQQGETNGEDDDASVVVELGQCSEGNIYDVFANTCRIIGCRDGKCSQATADLTTTTALGALEVAETAAASVSNEEEAAQATTEMNTMTKAMTSIVTAMPNPTSITTKTNPDSKVNFTTSLSTTAKTRTADYKMAKAYKSTVVSNATSREKVRKSKLKTAAKSTTRRTTAKKFITAPTPTTPATVTTKTTTITSTPTSIISSSSTVTSSATIATSTTTSTTTTPTTTTQISTISTTHATTSVITPSSTATTVRETFVLIIPSSTVDNRVTKRVENSDDSFVEAGRPVRGRDMKSNPTVAKAVATTTSVTIPRAKTTEATATTFPETDVENLEREMVISAGEPANHENDSDKNQSCSDILVMFQFDRLQSLASLIGTLASMVGLLVCFITVLVLPSMRDTVRGKVLLSLILSLFAVQLLYLFAVPSNQPFTSRLVCYWTGTVMHYCVLATFFWVNVLAIDSTLTIMCNQRDQEACDSWGRFFGYSIYAWLTPAAVIAVCLTIDALEADQFLIRPCYGDGVCWVTGRFALLLTVALPAGFLTLVSLFLFFLSASHMCVNVTYKDLKTKRNRIPDRRRLTLYVSLTLIVVLTWVFGFVATFTGPVWVWWVFIGSSSAQGNFVCVAFVCTRKVFQQLRDRGKGGKGSSSTNWSYQKDRYPPTVDRTPANHRFPGSQNEIVLHETSM